MAGVGMDAQVEAEHGGVVSSVPVGWAPVSLSNAGGRCSDGPMRALFSSKLPLVLKQISFSIDILPEMESTIKSSVCHHVCAVLKSMTFSAMVFIGNITHVFL